MLELNGYEQRPIAALKKSLFSDHDQFTMNKIKYFSGPVKVRALKNENANKPKAPLRRQIGKGWEGRNTPSPASQRIE